MPSPSPTQKIAEKFGPGVLKFGATGSAQEFQSRTTKTEYSPELNLDDATPMLDGSDYQPEGTWGGTLSGTFYQDYSLTGLVAWCHEHAGEIMDFEFTPKTDSGMTITGKCIIKPVKIGGDPKKVNTTDFEFTIVGDKPTMKAPGA